MSVNMSASESLNIVRPFFKNFESLKNNSDSVVSFVQKGLSLLFKGPILSTTQHKQIGLVLRRAMERNEVSEHGKALLTKIETVVSKSLK